MSHIGSKFCDTAAHVKGEIILQGRDLCEICKYQNFSWRELFRWEKATWKPVVKICLKQAVTWEHPLKLSFNKVVLVIREAEMKVEAFLMHLSNLIVLMSECLYRSKYKRREKQLFWIAFSSINNSNLEIYYLKLWLFPESSSLLPQTVKDIQESTELYIMYIWGRAFTMLSSAMSAEETLFCILYCC